MRSSSSARVAPELVTQAQQYLATRKSGGDLTPELEAGWLQFYDNCSRKVRNFGIGCRLSNDELPDCIQEVWRELLVRLPAFRLDIQRGQFETWLYRIVRSRAIDLLRSRHAHLRSKPAVSLGDILDDSPDANVNTENQEILGIALCRLRHRLSPCNYQILYERLARHRSVAEVAEEMGLSRDQIWYRYHRARRQLEEIGCGLASDDTTHKREPMFQIDEKKSRRMAQGRALSSVSPSRSQVASLWQEGNVVDLVFKKVELGRKNTHPEWKVEWNCHASPTPVLYIRKLAMVAYAEFCGPEEIVNSHWPQIANGALAAGIAAGIATIIVTPTAALPIFRAEFTKQLCSKARKDVTDSIQVALSAQQEANGPWSECDE